MRNAPAAPRTEPAGLVPGGLYSVYWGTLAADSEQPLCPGVERTLPRHAMGGGHKAPAPNAFVVDATGTATFHGRTDGALFDATQVFFAIVHHFRGRTSYPSPNVGEQLPRARTAGAASARTPCATCWCCSSGDPGGYVGELR